MNKVSKSVEKKLMGNTLVKFTLLESIGHSNRPDQYTQIRNVFSNV